MNRIESILSDYAPALASDLDRKRSPAATTMRGSRILEDKSLPHQCLFVIERHFLEIDIAFRVHENPRSILLDHLIALSRLSIKPHGEPMPGAAAALHAQAQASLVRNALLGKEFSNLLGRLFSDVNHLPVLTSLPYLNCIFSSFCSHARVLSLCRKVAKARAGG